MRIIKWKASKIEIIEKNKIFFYKGLIVACCDNEMEYKIPYGACDKEKERAYEKAISEMCERCVWFTVYSMYPKLFPDTKGFSAHIDKKMGKLNSVREYIERKLLEKIVLCLKKNSIEDLYKMFSIKRRGNQIIFFNYSSIYNTYFVFIFIEHTYIKEGMEQIGFVVGMGKSRNFFSAYQGGLNEAKLVENVLQKVIEQGKVYSVNGVLRKEVNKYLDIFYNNKLFEILNDKDSEIKINDNIVSNDSYNTIDLSEYVPTFLKKFNRLVYYTSEYKIINEIKKVI